MKNVISVDSLIDTCLHPERNGLLLKEQVAEGASYEWLVKRELKSQLHSLLISKLPEKSKKIGPPMGWQIREDGTLDTHDAGYAKAIDDVKAVLDELFRSGDES